MWDVGCGMFDVGGGMFGIKKTGQPVLGFARFFGVGSVGLWFLGCVVNIETPLGQAFWVFGIISIFNPRE
jgi:hypothetical protein